ncbi:hypothetical protein [Citricoccus sp. GCM10030269]|uniref:hypothetical protein n=1 Tax=Citricoccus sp. GCM10030269 TaxID=3273388 RepID=UPI003606702E
MGSNISLNLDGVETFEQAADRSAGSGEELLAETVNLENAVVALKETFKGNGARAYNNFMVKVNEVQNQLAEALALINVGQGDLYKTYLQQEDESTDQAEQALGQAEGTVGGKL